MSSHSSRIVPATLAFNTGGTPVSPAFDDVYHSASGERGPWGQAEEVFLRGNGLLGETSRWRGRRHFTVLETGFGLGLNFIATASAWLNDSGRGEWLHFMSVEKHPFQQEDMRTLWRRLARDMERKLVDELVQQWPLLTPGLHRLEFAGCRIKLTLAFGDAVTLLPKLALSADAIYLDGFAPRKNPELWSPRIFASLAKLAARDATVATWSASASVRDGLAAAGFAMRREPGYGGKRHQLNGVYTGHIRRAAFTPAERRAIVIGAGLAGCGITHALTRRGWRVTLIDRHDAPAREASGNLAGTFHPVMSRDDNLLARLTRNAFLNNLRAWRTLHAAQPFAWATTGALQLPSERRRGAGLPPVADWPPELVRAVNADDARQFTGAPLTDGGLWFPDGGWLQPASLCAAQLAASAGNTLRIFATAVDRCEYSQDGWKGTREDGGIIAEAPVLILANALDAQRLLPAHSLPLKAVRGQLTHLPADALPRLKACVCGNGYLLPALHGEIVSGATYGPGDTATDVREADHADNLRRVAEIVTADLSSLDAAALNGRASVRCVTPDRLPVIGALPDPDAAATTPSRARRLPGLYCATGFASRGILWGTFAGEVIAAQIEGEPLPTEKDLLAAIDPARTLKVAASSGDESQKRKRA
ncbi:MAG: bifunctional tRNA (5-methylaminomethyl-2-thiouridine)(34)-methyltransferase MnmD/FAD-dependent 5-carboxymethylaminomethyl-2-thiouridine(34) oxidoreductase MnmC [Betaproteobacteria bacterium]|nr:bifunctional tRNA (5-methylaminomethyl-2-thiouridine)(34)-methyltransferase MnmD/FAD-dependent 5-carboxymethylaminomethyl-2-thiouridine(34) oxidoreductase MnmC [Betaproteobacteria bacterium]